MGENALLRKLEASVISNNKKAFIDIIFDFTTDDILALTEDKFNRITDISHQIKLEDVGEFFSYLGSEGIFHLKNAMSGSNELNNLLISRFYLSLFLCMFQEHNEKFALAIANYGTVCSLLSDMGVNTRQNLKEAIKLYHAAQEIFAKDSTDYARAMMNEGNARQSLADRGVDTRQNLKEAIKLYHAAQEIFAKDSASYARAMANEGNARQSLADRGVDTRQNLKEAIKLYHAAQEIFAEGSVSYALAMMNEGNARQSLADRGVDTKQNLNEAIKLYRAAQEIFAEGSASYARAMANEGTARRSLADRGVDTKQNLNEAIKLCQAAREIFAEGSADYARAMMNEGNARQRLADRGVDTKQNLKRAIELAIGSISILERLKDGGTYSIALLNLNKFLISNFRKSGDRKYLEEAEGILEDAEAKINDREVWDKEILLATLHEVRANLLEFEGKQGIHEASREYQEAYKLTGNPFYKFMDEFLQARIDIGSFCDLVGSWEKTGKTEIFLDYYDYSVFECHLEKAVSGGSTDLLNREKEFRSALKKLKEIEERTQIKPIKDRVSAYVYLMDALADCFRRDTYAAARAKVRAACEIFHECDDRDGRTTCDIFYNAIIKNEGFDAWLEIMRNKDRISCNFYRLLQEGAGSKISEVDHRRLHETTARIEEKVDNISDTINDLDASYGRIRLSMEQGFADQDANLQHIMDKLDSIRQKLVELDEISKRFGTSFYSGTVFISRRFVTSLNKNHISSIVHV